MTYKIEKGIPLHERNRSGIYQTYITKLEIGDSIGDLEFNEVEGFRSAFRRLKLKMISRKMPDGTYRIWRAA